MVAQRTVIVTLLIFTLTVIPVLAISRANAQNIVYSIDHQWCQLFINQDGTIDLKYNLTLTVSSGVAHAVDIGMPTSDFRIGQAVDQNGHVLGASDTSIGNTFQVTVTLDQPLLGGNSLWFTLTTNVAHIIQNDTTNPGNFGMEFAPEWMPVKISDVRVQIVFPPNATASNVVSIPDKMPNGTSIVEGRFAMFWQIPVLQANQHFIIGVSFPQNLLPTYNPESKNNNGGGGFIGEGLGLYFPLLIFLLFAVFLIVGVSILSSRKKTYSSPKLSMETLGIRRGLTAVEASYLLDLKPPQIVTEILYSLLQKRAVWVETAKPSLKLRVLAPYENRTGTAETPLRYYEIDFLGALKTDGTLDEEKLAHTVMFLRDTVEEKLRGYSRKDTVNYYHNIVSKAWTQVEQAGTVELASNAYDQQLLWLMIDPSRREKTETVFRDGLFQPNPLWFWWWYGYTSYHPHPTYMPNINIPAQSGNPPAIPGSEFANNIATAVENTSNSMVINFEKFANSILPPGPKTSHEPAKHGASCVCACHACACACACVSCACACAGGGVH